MQVVRGAGFQFLTEDPILIAVVKRCDDLARENERLRREETARFRTLRRDVKQIKRAVRA